MPNIVGIKDSSGNLSITADFIRETPDDFTVLVGKDTLIYPALAMGADGAIAGTANVAPALVSQIYNAYVAGGFDRLERKPDSDLQLAFEGGPMHTFRAMKAVFPHMKEQRWGRIINLSSAHALVASPYKSAYVAAKHGIVGLTKVAAIELANAGVTCNAICPGWVLTPLVQKQLDARAAAEGKPLDQVRRDLLAEKQPMEQFTTPENLGALAAFLCSDAAATMTGTPVSMDGGWTAT